MIKRSFVEELWPSQRVAIRLMGETCCKEIELDGKIYRCKRAPGHGGIHDADKRHHDGGLVRW